MESFMLYGITKFVWGLGSSFFVQLTLDFDLPWYWWRPLTPTLLSTSHVVLNALITHDNSRDFRHHWSARLFFLWSWLYKWIHGLNFRLCGKLSVSSHQIVQGLAEWKAPEGDSGFSIKLILKEVIRSLFQAPGTAGVIADKATTGLEVAAMSRTRLIVIFPQDLWVMKPCTLQIWS